MLNLDWARLVCLRPNRESVVGSRGVTSCKENGSSKGGANFPKCSLHEMRMPVPLRCGVSQASWERCANGNGLLLIEM